MNELENKYLYIINNILQGYDRDIVINHVAELEKQKAELIKTLNNWLISFKSTLRKQEYQVETFNILNDRYIESAELLKKHGVEI